MVAIEEEDVVEHFIIKIAREKLHIGQAMISGRRRDSDGWDSDLRHVLSLAY